MLLEEIFCSKHSTYSNKILPSFFPVSLTPLPPLPTPLPPPSAFIPFSLLLMELSSQTRYPHDVDTHTVKPIPCSSYMHSFHSFFCPQNKERPTDCVVVKQKITMKWTMSTLVNNHKGLRLRQSILEERSMAKTTFVLNVTENIFDEIRSIGTLSYKPFETGRWSKNIYFPDWISSVEVVFGWVPLQMLLDNYQLKQIFDQTNGTPAVALCRCELTMERGIFLVRMQISMCISVCKCKMSVCVREWINIFVHRFLAARVSM